MIKKILMPIVILFILVTPTLATDASKPFFWSIEKWFNNLERGLTPSNSKILKDIEISSERLSEVKDLLKKGKLIAAEKNYDSYIDSVERALYLAKKKDDTELITKIQRKVEKDILELEYYKNLYTEKVIEKFQMRVSKLIKNNYVIENIIVVNQTNPKNEITTEKINRLDPITLTRVKK